MGIFLYLTHALLGGYLRLASPMARPVGSPRRPLFQALRHSNARRARPAFSYRIDDECFAVAADRHLPARQRGARLHYPPHRLQPRDTRRALITLNYSLN